MRHRLYALFAAVTLVALMALGAWQVVAALARIDASAIPSSFIDFREGRTTGTLQSQVERALPLRAAMIATANGIRYVLLRGTGEDVRLGHDGWLFLADELRFTRDSERLLRQRLDAAVAVTEALAARGILLVIALVPDKARVHAEALRGGEIPAEHPRRYGQALSFLRSRDVTTVDLLTPLARGAREGPVYYRTDTHWNARGARIAASSIATDLGGAGIALPRTRFRTIEGDERDRAGDLIRLMGLEHAPGWLRPHPDREREARTEEIDRSAGAALLGDFEIPVALVGTSYAMRANFHGFLQQALEARVLNAARDGAGFAQSLAEYLANDAFRDSPPKVIVWELPERVLSAPATSVDPPAGGRFSLPPR
jgi:alginate O-acetyltransferase complex protein AlgJ